MREPRPDGEPERGMGQREAAEQPAEQSPGHALWDGELDTEPAERPGEDPD